MKHLILIGTFFLLSTEPSFAHHHQQVRETCNAYRYTETYKPGHYLPNGTWVSGRVVQGQVEIPCSSYGTPTPVVAHHHSGHHHHPTQQQAPPQSSQHVQNVVQASAGTQRCDGLSRVLVGGLGGGIAGRYIGGGSKSKHTIRNTTIGAVAGGLLGRVLPC